MTLFNPAAGDGFTPLHEPGSLFVAGIWQVEETGFRPIFDLAARRPEPGTETHDGDEAANNDTDTEEKLAADILAQKTADAYSQGYLNGQQAMIAHLDAEQEQKNALGEAINRLKPANEARLARQLWETVLSLFREAAGQAEIDKQWLQERCEAVLDSIAAERGEACLYVAPGDAILLQGHDIGASIIADPELLPGSVRLAYPSGQITSGSLSIEQEIESRIQAAGGASC